MTPSPSAPLLSLAWLTVAGAHPLAHIDAARDAGFGAVGLRILSPPGGSPMVPVVGDAALVRDVRHRLDDTGMRVLDVETLWIGPDVDVRALQAAFEVAAELGARYLLAMGHDPDATRLAGNVAALCEAAGAFGIRVGIEFAAYTAIPDLPAAVRLLDAAGRPPNASLLVDALHFARSGGRPSDLAAVAPGRIGYGQLADARGPRPADAQGLQAEARTGRFLPGDGELPLVDLLRALPAGLPLAVECPTRDLAALPVDERARRAAAATRRVLAAADAADGLSA